MRAAADRRASSGVLLCVCRRKPPEVSALLRRVRAEGGSSRGRWSGPSCAGPGCGGSSAGNEGGHDDVFKAHPVVRGRRRASMDSSPAITRPLPLLLAEQLYEPGVHDSGPVVLPPGGGACEYGTPPRRAACLWDGAPAAGPTAAHRVWPWSSKARVGRGLSRSGTGSGRRVVQHPAAAQIPKSSGLLQPRPMVPRRSAGGAGHRKAWRLLPERSAVRRPPALARERIDQRGELFELDLGHLIQPRPAPHAHGQRDESREMP